MTDTKSFLKQADSNISDDSNKDIAHAHPRDSHLKHVWIWEPQTKTGVLTQDGMTQIAIHKYVAGRYTILDTLLNPIWVSLTNLLPLWLAPNAVTTIGGFCCLVSYLVTWSYNPNYNVEDGINIPNWILVMNGLASVAYYTLDCMDGKQARRTSSSSPLGQLFDHGMDCICNLAHVSLVQCILNCPSNELIWLQCSLQFTFFQAQWEEYYTGILPHSTGDVIGVTETNYGLALWSICTGLFASILGLRTVYTLPVSDTVQSIISNWPITKLIIDDTTTTTTDNNQLLVRQIFVVTWVTLMVVLSFLSLIRVGQHLKWSFKRYGSAISKLLSPGIVCACAIQVVYSSFNSTTTTTEKTPSWLSMRRLTIAIGTCMCLCTIKMIVYSMAHMAYATIQLDIIPVVMFLLVVQIVPNIATSDIISTKLLVSTVDIMATYYVIRLCFWTHAACTQLCNRLQIFMFRIKKKQ